MLLGTFQVRAQSLETYFATAAENNPGLQSKYKAFQAALQRVPQVSSLPDPTFSFGYFISPVETRLGPQKAKFSLSQMFPWFGTLKAREDAATLAAEAKFQEFVDARNQLYYEVAAAYYPLYKLSEWKQIERENIEILNSYKEIATRNFENGKGAMVDVLRVDIMLKDASTNLEILNQEEKPLLTKFNKMLNRSAEEKVTIEVEEKTDTMTVHLNKDSLMEQHPVLKKLELMRQSSEAAESAARKNGYPNMGLGLDYVVVGEPTDMQVEDSGRDVIMPMLSVSIPIFRKKYNAAVKEAQLTQESLALQKEEFTNNLASRYEQVWFDISRQEQLIKLYNEQIKETRRALKLLTTAYANSGKDFEEILRMQQELLKYKKKKVDAISRYKTAVARMEYVMGAQ
ncbi:outer membrane protein TolC [Marinilabilia salmonicolor]|jgi:outer membrane protein TolC|uniref:Outer membrane protein TolC n=2 Tax=Marinilabilia salmonicolor TaxID=989 RepID=A0A2T0WXI0_9BACT|nr:TolC family protein [Marinilabilia salmonicolor]PRY91367.1 outer membrane protein TolC [Marinilabilia salmonicolor]RCW39020.1 outer membrane protein TolC [Marinilabilia salmonicolor]